MKKGIFGTWFREIATIIFTQTVQAFLLAVVMSIIISALGKNTGAGDQDGQTAAAGLLAIIALSQFGKIELLIKNIFGVTSGLADVSMQGGRAGLTAGKMLALGGAKRLMDNGKKVATGVKALKTKGEIKDMTKEMKQLENDKEIDAVGGQMESMGRKLTSAVGGDSEGLNVSSGAILDALNAQTDAIKQQTAEIQRNRQEDKIKDLAKKIEEANKVKHEQIKTGVSGITETIGAAYGATAGLTYGLAQGDHIGEATLAGAGAGDIIGQEVTNLGDSTIKTAKSVGKSVAGAPKKVSGNLKGMREQRQKSDEAIKAINDEIEKVRSANSKDMDDQIKQLQEQARSVQKSYNEFYKASGGMGTKAINKMTGNASRFSKKDMKKFDANHNIGKDV